jgi:hypothetical protein
VRRRPLEVGRIAKDLLLRGLMSLAVVEDLDELEQIEPGLVACVEPDRPADPDDVALDG